MWLPAAVICTDSTDEPRMELPVLQEADFIRGDDRC
jgi:hypothetical protein